VTPEGQATGMEEHEGLGVLVVRAWLHDQSLVARVTRTPEVDAVAPVTLVVTDPRQLHREVTRWLRELGVEDPDGGD
jgi:hypothetical protein